MAAISISLGTGGPALGDMAAPPPSAPALAASASLSGRTLTVAVDSLSGWPVPALSVAITADGVPVAAAGTGPWTHTVADSAADVVLGWTVTAANGIAPDATAGGTETVPANLAGQAFTVTPNADGEIEIDGVTGALTITVTAPPGFAGTYTTDIAGTALTPAALAAGPQCLVAPEIAGDGTPAAGEAVGLAAAGLWIHDAGRPDPVFSYRLQADGAGDGVFADIPGATALPHVLGAAEAGDGVRAVETAAQAGTGTREAASAALSVAAPAAVADLAHLGSFENTAQNLTALTLPGVPLGAEAADREIYVFWSGRLSADALSGQWGCTVAGVAAAEVLFFHPSRQAAHIGWKAAVPAGAAGDVVLTQLAGSARLYGSVVSVLRAGGAPAMAAPVTGFEGTLAGNGGDAFDLSLDIGAGDALFVAGACTNGLSATPPGFVFTGAAERIDGGNANGGGAHAFDANLGAGAPRTVTVGLPVATTNADGSAIAVRFTP